MNKAKWMEHAEAVGYFALGSYAAKAAHAGGCKECKARLRTKRATASAKWRHEALLSCGLVRVKGALGGVYYE